MKENQGLCSVFKMLLAISFSGKKDLFRSGDLEGYFMGAAAPATGLGGLAVSALGKFFKY